MFFIIIPHLPVFRKLVMPLSGNLPEIVLSYRADIREEAMNDECLMAAALDEARLALLNGELPVGAVVARGGQIVARGRNRREGSGDPTAHAEIEAIRAAVKILGGWRLTGCALYVTLEPCAMCAGAVVAARLDRVVYGASDPEGGCCGSIYRLTEDPAFTHFAQADGGVLAAECRALITEFFAARRRGEKYDD
jgi:tRNA(adenine34) deaminase